VDDRSTIRAAWSTSPAADRGTGSADPRPGPTGLRSESANPRARRRSFYRDETQCQIEALLSGGGGASESGDDANVKTGGCYGAVVAWLRRYEYLASYVYVSIVLQVHRLIGRVDVSRPT